MKWVVFAVAACGALSVPAWIKSRPQVSRWVWTAFGLLPFLIYPLHLYMAARSWPLWSGHVKGIEITVLDLLAIGLLLSLPSGRYPLQFKLPALLYAAAVLLSCFQSDNFEISFAYLVQLCRVYLIYAVVAKASSDDQVLNDILRGLVIGAIIQAVVVLVQRFGLGQLQATGTFVHQNSLGISSHFVAFPMFALLLRQPKGWLGLPLAAVFACIVVELLTVSRATIGLAAVGFLIVFAVSASRQWTSRKMTVAITGVAAVLVLAPMALNSLSQRTNLAEESDYDERAAFERAAKSVLADNPLGVGPNNYVVAVNTRGYNDQAGVVPTYNSRSAHVHNVYYLVAAETGWLGIISYVILLALPLLYAVRASRRLRNSYKGDLLLGFSVSLLIVYVHSLFEWTFITWDLQYFAAIAIGLVVGMSGQTAATRRQSDSGQPAWRTNQFGQQVQPRGANAKQAGNVRFLREGPFSQGGPAISCGQFRIHPVRSHHFPRYRIELQLFRTRPGSRYPAIPTIALPITT